MISTSPIIPTPALASPEESSVTIVLAYEWALVREGLALLCERTLGLRVVAQVETGEAALHAIEQTQPKLALLDWDLSDVAVTVVLERIRLRTGRTRCAVLSTRREGRTVLNAIRSGAAGYLLKTDTVILMEEGIRTIQDGGVYISPSIDMQTLTDQSPPKESEKKPLGPLGRREYQVFTLLVEGVRAKEIAARLNLSAKTVDTYRASLMRKLEIHDLAGLVKFAVAQNLTSLPS